MKKPSKHKENSEKRPLIKEQENWLSIFLRKRYILIFLLPLTVYSTIIFNDYNLDDELVTRNHPITSQGVNIDNLHKIFTQPYYKDNMGYSYGYRPLTFLTFALEHDLCGDNPHISHLVNLILYSLLCVVLLLTLQRIFVNYSKLIPLAATMIFACHPLHSEVVASIKNRDEILSFMFGLLVFYSFFSGKQSFWQRIFSGLIFFIAGMLFKPNLVLLPILLVIALLLFRKEKGAYILLISFIFSLTSVFFTENLDDGTKILYVLLNIGFSGMMILFLKKSFGSVVNYFMRSIIEIRKTSGIDQVEKEPSEHKKGRLYFAFLILNLLLGLCAVFISSIYSSPWILIVILSVYAIELFFDQFDKLWPVVILFNAVSLFLVSGEAGQPIDSWVLDSFLILFIVFNLSAIINIRGRMFWPVFIAFYVLYIIHIIYQDKSNLLAGLFIVPTLTYIYRSKKYQSLGYKIFLFIVIGLIVLPFLSPKNYPRGTIGFYFTLMDLIFFTAVLSASYLRTPLRKFPAFLSLALVAYLAGTLMFYPYFYQSTLNELSKAEHSISKIGHNATAITRNIQGLQKEKNLPTIYTGGKLDRPITYIEVPVAFGASAGVKYATSAYQFNRYILLILKPWPMSFYYGYKEIESHHLNEPLVIWSVFFFLFLFVSGLLCLHRNKVISFGIYFMVLSILPYLYIVSAMPGMLADRYTFQSSLGFSLVVAGLFAYFYDLRADSFLSRYLKYRNVKGGVLSVFAMLILVYSIMSVIRNGQWKDSISLMRHDLNVVPYSIQAHNLLGINLVKKSFESSDIIVQNQLRQEALVHLKAAYFLYPDYFNFPFDIGRVYALLNVPDSALDYFRKAYVIKSDYPDAATNIADIYIAKNDFYSSIPYLRQLIKENPNDYSAYDKLSLAYFKTQQKELSIQTNMTAIKMAPNRPEPYVNIGICYFSSNAPDSARLWFNKALLISPNHPMAINYLKQLR